MMLKAASGLAARCVPWRMLAIAAVLSATAWLALCLLGWCWPAACVALPAYLVAPVFVLGRSARRGTRFRDMARGLPFLMWEALTAGGKLAAWKLVLYAGGGLSSKAVKMVEDTLRRRARFSEGWSMVPLFSEMEDMGLVLVEAGFQLGGGGRLFEVRELGQDSKHHVALAGSDEEFSQTAARVSELMGRYYGQRSSRHLALLRCVGELTMCG